MTTISPQTSVFKSESIVSFSVRAYFGWSEHSLIFASTPDIDISLFQCFSSSFRCFREVASPARPDEILSKKNLPHPASYSSQVSSSLLHSQKQPQLRNRVYEIISDWIIKRVPVTVWLFDGVWACVCVCMSDGGLLEGLHYMNLPLCCGMEPKASLTSKTPTGTKNEGSANGNERAIFSLSF